MGKDEGRKRVVIRIDRGARREGGVERCGEGGEKGGRCEEGRVKG